MKITTITLDNNQELKVSYTDGQFESIIAKTAFLYSPWNGIDQDLEIEEEFNDLEDLEHTLKERFEINAITELEELFDESEVNLTDEVLKIDAGLSFKNTALLYYTELLELLED